MYSDDEECGFGRGRRENASPSPRRRGADRPQGGQGGGRVGGEQDARSVRDRDRSDRSRSRGGGSGGRRDGKGDKGKGRGGGRGQQRPRTTGRELPKLNSIHKGAVVSVRDFGAFVRLGEGDVYKDGLLHISRISATSRLDQVADVLSEGDTVWVKVVEIKTEEGKHSLDMRYVGQRNGEDKDPNNTQLESGGKGKSKGTALEPIRIGAIQAASCARCGAAGHTARECFAQKGQQYSLVEEVPEEAHSRPPSPTPRHKAQDAKAGLKRRAPSAKSSSSSSSSSSDDKKAKQRKKKSKEKEKNKKKEKAGKGKTKKKKTKKKESNDKKM